MKRLVLLVALLGCGDGREEDSREAQWGRLCRDLRVTNAVLVLIGKPAITLPAQCREEG